MNPDVLVTSWPAAAVLISVVVAASVRGWRRSYEREAQRDREETTKREYQAAMARQNSSKSEDAGGMITGTWTSTSPVPPVSWSEPTVADKMSEFGHTIVNTPGYPPEN